MTYSIQNLFININKFASTSDHVTLNCNQESFQQAQAGNRVYSPSHQLQTCLFSCNSDTYYNRLVDTAQTAAAWSANIVTVRKLPAAKTKYLTVSSTSGAKPKPADEDIWSQLQDLLQEKRAILSGHKCSFMGSFSASSPQQSIKTELSPWRCNGDGPPKSKWVKMEADSH